MTSPPDDCLARAASELPVPSARDIPRRPTAAAAPPRRVPAEIHGSWIPDV
ncbi:hypothetical protein [Streptomyces sp. 135]|uniref:hypothetical protein n=1 Tax=Streptomyces sp. 135 TaxID=2838850 RepID=UPI001CC1714F|nr:hypothetical protein [Streptomyces sp. 135]